MGRPEMQGLHADAVPAAEVLGLGSGLGLLQDRDDLPFDESALPHRGSKGRAFHPGTDIHAGSAVGDRLLPTSIVVDNGPEFASKALDAWCHERGIELIFIRPGKPIENAYAASFNGRVREECLNQNAFESITHARSVIEGWREDCNTVRPHGTLDGLSPENYLQQWASAKTPQPFAVCVDVGARASTIPTSFPQTSMNPKCELPRGLTSGGTSAGREPEPHTLPSPKSSSHRADRRCLSTLAERNPLGRAEASLAGVNGGSPDPSSVRRKPDCAGLTVDDWSGRQGPS